MPKVVFVEIIDCPEEVPVYDIQVADDESFIVGDAVLHNSDICRSRANRLWTIDKVPIGHTLPFRPVPLHWKCRSQIIGVMLSYNDLPASIRRRLDPEDFTGQAPNEPDLKDWMAAHEGSDATGAINIDDARRQLGL